VAARDGSPIRARSGSFVSLFAGCLGLVALLAGFVPLGRSWQVAGLGGWSMFAPVVLVGVALGASGMRARSSSGLFAAALSVVALMAPVVAFVSVLGFGALVTSSDFNASVNAVSLWAWEVPYVLSCAMLIADAIPPGAARNRRVGRVPNKRIEQNARR
jgi:hypothetical protein